MFPFLYIFFWKSEQRVQSPFYFILFFSRVNINKLVIPKKEYTKLTSLNDVKLWLEGD